MPTPPTSEDSRRPALPRALAVMIVLAAVVALIWFGRLRPAHPGRSRDVDFWYCYSAGVVWNRGLDPYNDETYRTIGTAATGKPIECNFAYAPTASALVSPLARLTPEQARWVIAGLNVGSALVVGLTLASAANRRLAAEEIGRWRPVVLSGIAVLAIGSPQASLNLYQGQTTLFCLALIGLAFWAEERGLPWICGAVLGIATFKISLPAFLIALAVLRGKWKVVLPLAVTALLLAWTPLLRAGPVGLTREWLSAMKQYKTFPQNGAGYVTSFGAAEILGAIGVPGGLVPLLGAAGLAWLLARRNVLDPLETLGVALALPVMFVSGHLYDTVALFPLCLALLLATRTAPVAFIGAIAGVVLLVLPPSAWNQALSYRWGVEVVALALLAGLAAAVEARRRSAAGPNKLIISSMPLSHVDS